MVEGKTLSFRLGLNHYLFSWIYIEQQNRYIQVLQGKNSVYEFLSRENLLEQHGVYSV